MRPDPLADETVGLGEESIIRNRDPPLQNNTVYFLHLSFIFPCFYQLFHYYSPAFSVFRVTFCPPTILEFWVEKGVGA